MNQNLLSLTKIYSGDYVYLYHYELTMQKLRLFIESYITNKTNYQLKWKDQDEMVCIVRDEDLNESIEECKKLQQQYHKIYLKMIESDDQSRKISHFPKNSPNSRLDYRKNSQDDATNLSFAAPQSIQSFGTSQKPSASKTKTSSTNLEIKTPGFKDQLQSFQSIPWLPSNNNHNLLMNSQDTFQQLDQTSNQPSNIFTQNPMMTSTKRSTSIEFNLEPDLQDLVDSKYNQFYGIQEEVDEDLMYHSQVLDEDKNVIQSHIRNENQFDVFFPDSQSYSIIQEDLPKYSIEQPTQFSQRVIKSIETSQQNEFVKNEEQIKNLGDFPLSNPPLIPRPSREDSMPALSSSVDSMITSQEVVRKKSQQLKLMIMDEMESPPLHEGDIDVEERLDTVMGLEPPQLKKVMLSRRKSDQDQLQRSTTMSPQKLMKKSQISIKNVMTKSELLIEPPSDYDEEGCRVYCNSCSVQIKESYYNCPECEDFDLCGYCQARVNHEHEMEIMEPDIVERKQLSQIDSAHVDEEESRQELKLQKDENSNKKSSESGEESILHVPVMFRHTVSHNMETKELPALVGYESMGDLTIPHMTKFQ